MSPTPVARNDPAHATDWGFPIITGLEPAALKIGKAAAQHAAAAWLRRRQNKHDRTTGLADLAAAELASPLQRNKLDLVLADIAHQIAEQLDPLLMARSTELPPNEITAALDAVVDALQATDLSDDALYAADMDAELLARQVRATVPDLPKEAGLSEGGDRLYRFTLDQSCRYLIQVVQHLPVYPERTLTELLGRVATMAGQLTDLLARTPRTSLDEVAETDQDETFRARYLNFIATRLDRLELLGLTMRNRPRLALSVAYLSLTVTGRGRDQRRTSRWAAGWFGTDPARQEIAGIRVEAAIGDSSRVLIRGEAGSGKTTLLDWLAVTAARAGFTGQLAGWNGCVPIPIRLRRHAAGALPRPEQFCDELAPRWPASCRPAGCTAAWTREQPCCWSTAWTRYRWADAATSGRGSVPLSTPTRRRESWSRPARRPPRNDGCPTRVSRPSYWNR